MSSGGMLGVADFFFSGFSATTASVVMSSPATDDAFCMANRTTLVGSIIPDLRRSSYCPVSALKPGIAFFRLNALNHHGPFKAGVVGNLPHWLLRWHA